MSYTESDKRVFGPFNDGREQVYADPVASYRRLNFALGGSLKEHIRNSRSEDPTTRFAAVEKLVEATRYAFDLVPFDRLTAKGPVEAEIRILLKQFLDWVSKKNETPVTSPTCSPPTDPESYPNPLTTGLGPVSGSTSTGSDSV